MSKVDLFKFLAVDPSSLNLTAQQYYLSYSRYLLNDTTLSIKEKKEQIRLLRYLNGIKQETQTCSRDKLLGDGIRCVAGAWCTKDYSEELITQNGGLCDSCYYSLQTMLQNSKVCEFCQTRGIHRVCKDCEETLSLL